MKFEKAIQKLEKIILEIEDENTNIDDLIKLYEEGSKLAVYCKDYLNNVDVKMKEIINNNDVITEEDIS